MKKTTIMLILAFALFISACDDNSVKESNMFNSMEFANSLAFIYLPDYYPELNDEFDAIHKIIITEKWTNYSQKTESKSMVTNSEFFYGINGYSEKIEYSKINGKELIFKNEFNPKRYSSRWTDDESLSTDSDIEIEFKLKGETVHDTVWIPNSIGTVTFSNDSVDIDNGFTVNWTPSNNENSYILIKPYFYYGYFEDDDNLVPIEGENIYIKDTGEHTFTASYLNDVLEIPNELGLFSLTFTRVSTKLKQFADGKKTSVSVAILSKNASVYSKIKQ